jgi:translation elongation factor EF-1alpha
MIIAMNKMDLVKWSSEAFEKIKTKLNFYLLKIGFKEEELVYVPVSAYHSQNMAKKMDKPFESGSTVYNKTLIETIE